MAKTIFSHSGVEMTSFESIKLSMWIDKSGIYLNTLEKEERTKIVTDWLTKHRQDGINKDL